MIEPFMFIFKTIFFCFLLICFLFSLFFLFLLVFFICSCLCFGFLNFLFTLRFLRIIFYFFLRDLICLNLSPIVDTANPTSSSGKIFCAVFIVVKSIEGIEFFWLIVKPFSFRFGLYYSMLVSFSNWYIILTSICKIISR